MPALLTSASIRPNRVWRYPQFLRPSSGHRCLRRLEQDPQWLGKRSLWSCFASLQRRDDHVSKTPARPPRRSPARRRLRLLSSVYWPFRTSFRSIGWVRSPPLLHKVPDELGNLICCGIQRKMPSIDDVYFCLWHVTPVSLRFGGVERELILAPDHQQAWLLLAHPGLPLGVGVDV